MGERASFTRNIKNIQKNVIRKSEVTALETKR
jgi:hypothetical protein